MNPLNRLRSTHRISLRELTGFDDAWGTDLGAKISADLNRMLVTQSAGTLAVFDFSGIKRSDASFQREAIVETMRRHRPRLLFLIEGITNPDLRSNLVLALERRGDAVFVRNDDGRLEAIGSVSETQRRTLQAIGDLDEVTSRELLTKLPALTPPNATNRLNDLAAAGLLERADGAAMGGGRQYRFFTIR